MESCTDFPEMFKLTIAGASKRKNCRWVKKNKSKRCSVEGVKNMCKATCGSCESHACLDSPVQFRARFMNKKKRFVKCEGWADQYPKARCALDEVEQACPGTCTDTCNDDSNN